LKAGVGYLLLVELTREKGDGTRCERERRNAVRGEYGSGREVSPNYSRRKRMIRGNRLSERGCTRL
jgi:hypothetical protein